jgi:predicted PurR-regulated permease PerM
MKVNVDTRTFVRFWLVLLAIAVAILLIWDARSALILLGISFFLALALNYPVSLIARKLPGRSRALASAIAYVFVVLLLGIFLFAVIPPIIDQSIKFAHTVPGLVQRAGSNQGFINQVITNYGLRGQFNNAVASLQNHIGSITTTVGTNLLNGAGSLLSGLVNTLLVLIFTFFMLIEGPQWIERIWALYSDPIRLERHKKLSRQLYHVVKGYVNGQITVAGIAAVAAAVVTLALCLIFSIPVYLSLTVAAIIFLFELIPLFGATIGAVVTGVLLLLNNPAAAVIFIVYYLLYQQFENAFVSPKIQGNAVNISGLMVLASVTIGVALFGLLGGFIAIPVAGCVRIIVLHRLERNTHSRHARERKEHLPID